MKGVRNGKDELIEYPIRLFGNYMQFRTELLLSFDSQFTSAETGMRKTKEAKPSAANTGFLCMFSMHAQRTLAQVCAPKCCC